MIQILGNQQQPELKDNARDKSDVRQTRNTKRLDSHI
jgi:hypothetical protein